MHPPSTMTLGGLLKHLALNEVGWFGQTLRAAYPEPLAGVDWDADPDWEWRTARDDSPRPRGLYDAAYAGRDAAIDGALDIRRAGPQSVETSSSQGSLQPALDHPAT